MLFGKLANTVNIAIGVRHVLLKTRFFLYTHMYVRVRSQRKNGAAESEQKEQKSNCLYSK